MVEFVGIAAVTVDHGIEICLMLETKVRREGVIILESQDIL